MHDLAPGPAEDPDEDPDDDPDHSGHPGRPPARRRRRRLRRVLAVLTLALVLLAAVPVGIGWYLQHQITSRIGRIDGVFQGLTESERPAPPPPRPPGAEGGNPPAIGTPPRPP